MVRPPKGARRRCAKDAWRGACSSAGPAGSTRRAPSPVPSRQQNGLRMSGHHHETCLGDHRRTQAEAGSRPSSANPFRRPADAIAPVNRWIPPHAVIEPDERSRPPRGTAGPSGRTPARTTTTTDPDARPGPDTRPAPTPTPTPTSGDPVRQQRSTRSARALAGPALGVGTEFDYLAVLVGEDVLNSTPPILTRPTRPTDVSMRSSMPGCNASKAGRRGISHCIRNEPSMLMRKGPRP